MYIWDRNWHPRKCNESYTEENIISILTTKEDDKQRLITRGHKLAEQGLTHSLKKAPGSKKRKKNAEPTDTTSSTKDAPDPGVSKSSSDVSKRGNTSTPVADQAQDTGIKNAATSSLTARVLAEQNERTKRRKMGQNEAIKSLFSKKDGATEGTKRNDFMTRGFSLWCTGLAFFFFTYHGQGEFLNGVLCIEFLIFYPFHIDTHTMRCCRQTNLHRVAH